MVLKTTADRRKPFKKLKDRFWCPSVNVAPFATSTASCDLDLWLPKSNEVINRSWWLFAVSFIQIVLQFSVVRTNMVDGEPENNVLADTVGWQKHNNIRTQCTRRWQVYKTTHCWQNISENNEQQDWNSNFISPSRWTTAASKKHVTPTRIRCRWYRLSVSVTSQPTYVSISKQSMKN